jgi:maleylacetate reductase
MREFTYAGLPSQVVFGFGTRECLPDEVRSLGAKRALVLSTPVQAETAQALLAALGTSGAGIYAKATMHTPVHVTEDAVEHARALGADCLVSVGGGSTVGLGKAIALRTDLPQVAIPTTYAGSEVTPILGETSSGEKTTQRTLRVLPETVIYDVDLTLTLPAGLSATSGVNAMAHAVEALYARDRNPVTSLMAEEAIRALSRGLPRIVQDPRDVEARSDAFYGAWLSGVSLATVGMALHHKLAHVLGGTFHLPHAETHAVLLPHTAAYSAPAAEEAMGRIAAALGAVDAPTGLSELNTRLGVPRALRDLGMPEEGIERAAELALKNAYWNPQPLVRQDLRDLIARAWAGEAPRSPHA